MRHLCRFLVVALVACSGPHRATTTSPPPDPGLGSATGSGSATPPPATTEPRLPLWPAVTRGTLPNGLTYYVLPHHQPEHRAAMWLAVNAGSLQEDDDQQGLAHLVEHMAFNGTKRFPKQAIVDYLEKIGMEFGADVNAYTSSDQTVYMLQVPTDGADYVGTGLDILRDWAGGISFEPTEVDKERGVVLEEWRLGRGADERVFMKQVPVIYGGTRYASRLPIGQPEIIKGAPRDAVTRFYKDWYRPDLMAVIVVGDVDPAAITKEITARFGDLTGPAKPRPKFTGGALTHDVKIAIDTDPELRGSSVSIADLFPHRSEAYASDYRRFVLDGLYHRMLGERLASLARKPDAPFMFAFSSTGDQTRGFEGFDRMAFAKDGRLLDALEVLLTEVARVERHGFTQAELDRAKAGYLKATADSAAEWDQQEAFEYADELTRHFFEGELVIGRVAEDELSRRYTPGVTLDDVAHLADEWQHDATRAITIKAPATAKAVPTRAQVEAVVAKVAAADLAPWTEEAAPTTLVAQPPTGGTIVARTPADDLGVTRWTLSNGVKVLVLPTTYENQRVYLSGVSPGGLNLLDDKRFVSGRFAVEAVTAGGAGALSADQLDRALAGKNVNLWLWADDTTESLNGSASSADLATLLQLAYLRMAAPRKDPDAFKAWQLGRAEGLERRDVTPEIALNDLTQTTLTSNHKRRRPITAADVRAVDLDTALAAYRDRFGDAGDWTFVLVGNLDLATLEPLVATYLGGLPATKRHERWKDLGVKPPKGKVEKTVKAGQEPKAAVQLVFFDDDKWSPTAARDLEIMTAALEIRLREILREDMSGVYGVGVWGTILRAPVQRRQVQIRFGCAPENVDALRAATLKEIARMQAEGVAQEYLDKVKETRRRSHELALKENRYWLGLLGEAAEFGDDPHEDLSNGEAADRVTSDNIKASAKRFLSTKRYYSGTLVPAK